MPNLFAALEDDLVRVASDLSESAPEDPVFRRTHSARLICNTVSGQWLEAFASAHPQCLDLSTEEVVEQFVRPVTADRKCRFLDLPQAVSYHTEGEALRPASVFISHSWANQFRLLLATVRRHSRRGRRFWLDIFAVNQHQPSADLDAMAEVIQGCPEGMIMVIDTLAIRKDGFQSAVNPLTRIWCLFEAWTCLQCGRPVSIAMGHFEGDVFVEENENEFATMMEKSIDVKNADSTRPDDKVNILQKIGVLTLTLTLTQGGHSKKDQRLCLGSAGRESCLDRRYVGRLHSEGVIRLISSYSLNSFLIISMSHGADIDMYGTFSARQCLEFRLETKLFLTGSLVYNWPSKAWKPSAKDSMKAPPWRPRTPRVGTH